MVISTIFGNIVAYVSKPIKNDNQIIWRLCDLVRFDMPRVLFTSEAGFLLHSMHY